MMRLHKHEMIFKSRRKCQGDTSEKVAGKMISHEMRKAVNYKNRKKTKNDLVGKMRDSKLIGKNG